MCVYIYIYICFFRTAGWVKDKMASQSSGSAKGGSPPGPHPSSLLGNCSTVTAFLSLHNLVISPQFRSHEAFLSSLIYIQTGLFFFRVKKALQNPQLTIYTLHRRPNLP